MRLGRVEAGSTAIELIEMRSGTGGRNRDWSRPSMFSGGGPSVTRNRTIDRAELSDCWEDVERDPDLEEDLEYRMDDWEEVSAAADGERQFLFLPTNDELFREEAFIVADPTAVCDVVDHA